MIYLDCAATSWPKPPEVPRAMSAFLESDGGNPGRSGHRLSIAAARAVHGAREALAELFHVPDPLRVVFAHNATHALNLALAGSARAGDRIVTTAVEHNSMMRPLRALERAGARVTVVPCDAAGLLDLDALRGAVREGARLVAITHASNVTGAIQPVAEVGAIAHEAGALLLVDAAQTAGVVPIDLPALGIDLLAFTGHKGLQGPPGTGGLVLGAGVDASRIEPLVRGGTGSRSESEDQPDFLPDRFESGTPNGPGLAGLGAGVRWVLARGVEALRRHEAQLAGILVPALAEIAGVTVHGPRAAAARTAVVSCTIAGRSVSDVGLELDDEFGILTRVGLHCAPAAHRTIGTFPTGTIRFAPGPFTTIDDIRSTIAAVSRVARR